MPSSTARNRREAGHTQKPPTNKERHEKTKLYTNVITRRRQLTLRCYARKTRQRMDRREARPDEEGARTKTTTDGQRRALATRVEQRSHLPEDSKEPSHRRARRTRQESQKNARRKTIKRTEQSRRPEIRTSPNRKEGKAQRTIL